VKLKLCFLLVQNVLLVDFGEILGQHSIGITLLIQFLKEFLERDVIVRSDPSHHRFVIRFGDLELVADYLTSRLVCDFHWQLADIVFYAVL
jgi:hypothetical protein